MEIRLGTVKWLTFFYSVVGNNCKEFIFRIFAFSVGPKGIYPPHELEKKAKATHQRMGPCVCVYQLMEAGEGEYIRMGI